MSRSGDRKSIRVAAAQFDANAGDIAGNIAAHGRLIDEAGGRGVDVLIFPELSVTGYASPLHDDGSVRWVIDPDGSDFGPIKDACRRNRLVAVVGASVPAKAGLGFAAIVVDRRGRVCATYVKQHLDGHEKGWFVPGTTGCMIEVDGWRLGLGICYDASFPEHSRGLALEGADAYLVSGAFPLGDSDHRRSIYFPSRALENTVYVAFANFVGGHDGRQYCGQSAIHGPDGRPLDNAGPDHTGMAVAELDSRQLRQARESLQMLRDRRSIPTPIQTDTAQ